MTETKTGSFDPEDFGALKNRFQSLLGSQRHAEFRDEDDNGVAISRGRRNARLSIALRDISPAVHPQGYELYPYKELIVASRRLHPVETRGAMVRNKQGILVKWEPREQLPSYERMGRAEKKEKPTQPDYQPEITPYIDAVKAIDLSKIHDPYGRTEDEQKREKEVLIDFQNQTERLIEIARLNGTAAELMSALTTMTIYPETTIIYRYEASYFLPTGENVIIRQEAKNAGYATENVVEILSQRKDIPARIYEIRRPDRRLGVTLINPKHKQRNNPVSADKGEELITILKLLH